MCLNEEEVLSSANPTMYKASSDFQKEKLLYGNDLWASENYLLDQSMRWSRVGNDSDLKM